MFKQIVIALLIFPMLGMHQLAAQEDELRDPTRPLNYRVATGSGVKLELNSILIGDQRKLAVINGQRLRENEIIKGTDGIRLRSIESQAVVLQQGAKIWRLRLGGAAIRRTAPTAN